MRPCLIESGLNVSPKLHQVCWSCLCGSRISSWFVETKHTKVYPFEMFRRINAKRMHCNSSIQVQIEFIQPVYEDKFSIFTFYVHTKLLWMVMSCILQSKLVMIINTDKRALQRLSVFGWFW